jgi:hypothetical protein
MSGLQHDCLLADELAAWSRVKVRTSVPGESPGGGKSGARQIAELMVGFAEKV